MRNTVDRRGIATIPDVARQAGVSTATAARALGGYGSVRARPATGSSRSPRSWATGANSLARSMITGSTHTLGVVLSDIENSFFHRALRGVADTARARGYEVLLSNTDEDLETERKAVSVLAERRVDGLVVCPTDDGDHAHLEAVIASGIPVVLLDRRVSGLARRHRRASTTARRPRTATDPVDRAGAPPHRHPHGRHAGLGRSPPQHAGD